MIVASARPGQKRFPIYSTCPRTRTRVGCHLWPSAFKVQYWNTLILRSGRHGADGVLAAGDLPIYVESDAAGVVQPAIGVGAVHGRQGKRTAKLRALMAQEEKLEASTATH
ncbi:unnamed protein product [Ascophyllum nodosum]